AVAMTGGQPAEGGFDVPTIAAQIAAEGVRRIAVVADEAARLPPSAKLPPGTTRHTRAEMDAVQRDLRQYPGVSVLIYDQICATEKRRLRKRGKRAEASRSVVINADVCENCGDCSTQSRCIAIEPVATALGRKRRINPTACNVDLSCLKGFCPSFVTIAGAPRAPEADPRWQAREAALAAALAEPVRRTRPGPWRALFAGIGGGGIVTTGAIVAMAAHLDGNHVSTLDFTGLAQKNGAVVSHVQIGAGDALDVVRIPRGEAGVMFAADLAVAAGANVLERCATDCLVLGNLDLAVTAAFRQDRDLAIDAGLHRRLIARRTDGAASSYLHAVRLAERLFGNAQAMNTLLLGIAWQQGAVPVSQAALEQAITLNGVAVATNLRAFLWGRILAAQPALAGEILAGETATEDAPPSLAARIETRTVALTAYQNAAYAGEYRRLVDSVAAREAEIAGAAGALTEAVADSLYRVMAYKDEYEVARLHAAATYGADPVFHLSPPLPLGRDPATGRRRKIAIPGRFALPLFRLLRHGKMLRGSALDPFGYQAERRAERAAIAAYRDDVAAILASLTPANLTVATELAALAQSVRGFGPVKAQAAEAAAQTRAKLRAALAEAGRTMVQAAE
ncbi:MAG: 2-oxoacid:acceptor oxidoreductase family protein, partial [Rhodospirillales bacterium]|nr:2-oxoacid:acceptor oxidoreductase family protein [Rhodospirillales bacterium]